MLLIEESKSFDENKDVKTRVNDDFHETTKFGEKLVPALIIVKFLFGERLEFQLITNGGRFP